MMRPLLPDPRPYFAELPDPRRETRNKLHELHDILMIVLCAVLKRGGGLGGDGSVCRRKGKLAARVSEPAQW
ncbi:MAG: transposase family protein, partial [Gammaproteobacteria bacterium]